MNLVPKRKIGDGQQASVLGNMSIGGHQISDASITNAKIANLAVTTAKIGLLAVDTAQIADAAIENAKIGLLAVDTAQIADATITNAKIANLAVTNAKINDLDATKITAGYISVDRLEVGTITGAKLEDGTIADVKISTCSIGKLRAGNLTVTGTLTTGSFQTAAADNDRIVIDSTYIAGYNSANDLQFYLQASNGKAYCGAGNVVLDSSGITITGERLYLYGDATHYAALNWDTGTSFGRMVSTHGIELYSDSGDIELYPYAGATQIKGLKSTQSDVTGSRTENTIYRNTGESPLFVTISAWREDGSVDLQAHCDASSNPTTLVAINRVAGLGAGQYSYAIVSFVVPILYYYKAGSVAGGINNWLEWKLGE